MKLLGLAGKARSGKDTVAEIMCRKHGFVRFAFADPVKLACQQIFGLSHEQTWHDDKKEVVIPYWGMTPRKIFQTLGDCIKPQFGDDVWCKRFDMAYELVKDSDDVVVTDCRYDAEANLLREQGGVIVEIRRGVGLVGSAGDHASERGLSSLPDYVIENNGTLEELEAKVAELLGVLA